MLLSDEELVALGADTGLVVLPFLDPLPPEEREVAGRIAARGLFLRGLVRADGEGIPVVRPALCRLLAIRSEPDLVACGRRSDPGGDAQLRYWHRAGLAVVEEDVDASGLHRLVRQSAAGLTARVTSWLHHPDAARRPEPTRSRMASPTDAVGDALRCADLVIRRPDDCGVAPLLSVLSGPAGTALLRSMAPGPRDGPTQPPALRAGSRERVRAEVADLLDGTLAEPGWVTMPA